MKHYPPQTHPLDEPQREETLLIVLRRLHGHIRDHALTLATLHSHPDATPEQIMEAFTRGRDHHVQTRATWESVRGLLAKLDVRLPRYEDLPKTSNLFDGMTPSHLSVLRLPLSRVKARLKTLL